MKMWNLLCALVATFGLTFLMACSSSTPPVSETPTPVDSGEALFMAHCAGCHGGGGNALVPEKPVKGSSKLASLQTFQAFVRKPTGNMPAFGQEQLPDTQVAELYQYLLKTYR